LAGVLGKSTVEASSFLFSSEEMVVGHFARLVRSADKMYVGAAGVLLFVPFKNSEASSGGGSASIETVPAAGDEGNREKLARTCM
jgi:hypothetical protein